jgi:hypothetical protein
MRSEMWVEGAVTSKSTRMESRVRMSDMGQ